MIEREREREGGGGGGIEIKGEKERAENLGVRTGQTKWKGALGGLGTLFMI